MEKTSIQLEIPTRKRLQTFKIAKYETYDEMLNRLMDVLEDIPK